MQYVNSQLQINGNGVTADWFNEVESVNLLYHQRGLGALTDWLKRNPMLGYSERKERRIQEHGGIPEVRSRIEAQYDVTDTNRGVVERIDNHVRLLNCAVAEGRLTEKMYGRFYRHLARLNR